METTLNPSQPFTAPVELDPVAEGAPRYRPAGAKATAAVVTLLLVAAVELIALGANVLGLVALDRLDLDLAQLGTRIASGGFVLALLALPACAIAFCLWFHHAYRNMGCLGGLPSHSPGWAPGSFFVPILNVYRPYQIAKEIWLASMPVGRDGPGHLPVALWWGCFVAGNLVSGAAVRLTDTGAESVQVATVAMVAADLLLLCAALLGAWMVRRVERRQAACLGA